MKRKNYVIWFLLILTLVAYAAQKFDNLIVTDSLQVNGRSNFSGAVTNSSTFVMPLALSIDPLGSRFLYHQNGQPYMDWNQDFGDTGFYWTNGNTSLRFNFSGGDPNIRLGDGSTVFAVFGGSDSKVRASGSDSVHFSNRQLSFGNGQTSAFWWFGAPGFQVNGAFTNAGSATIITNMTVGKLTTTDTLAVTSAATFNGATTNNNVLIVTNSFDSNSRLLINSVGDTIMNWQSRELFSSGGVLAMDWGAGGSNRHLYDTIGINSVNWASRTLANTGGTVQLNWGSGVLQDGGSVSSINWLNRTMANSSGSTMMTWNGTALTNNSTTFVTPAVKFNNGNAITNYVFNSSSLGFTTTTLSFAQVQTNTFTVTGAAASDRIVQGWPSDLPVDSVWQMRATAANTISVYRIALSSPVITYTATFSAGVIKDQ